VLEFVAIALVLLIPTLAGAALLGAIRLWRVYERRARVRRSGGVVSGPPLERLAADLRRLRAELVRLEDATTASPGRQTRLRALRSAYGDCLLVACRTLDVPVSAQTSMLPDAELFRLEVALRDRGLDIRPAAVR